jgi:dGTPase
VSQVARTIARALNLNEDLVEAISLGHDLGHTPFGHVGEEALNKICSEGFRHNEQSLRVVDILENGGLGLNLTLEVREGILKHSKTGADILGEEWGTVATLEAQICKIADIITYINHDIGDAVRGGIITEKDLPQEAVALLGNADSPRINTLVTDVVQSSWSATGAGPQQEKPVITMSPEVIAAANKLREFLFQNVYNVAKEEAEQAGEVVRLLFQHFLKYPEKLPQEYNCRSDSIERKVVDYIAGMTDNYALWLAEDISPVKWQRLMWSLR